MKHTASARPPAAFTWLLCVIALLAVLALSLAPSIAQAAEATGTPAAAATPWGQIVVGVLSFLTTIFATWSHSEKKTAQKINETLVIGIEAASKLPGIAGAEGVIKARIRQTAEAYGVQPLLHRLVRDLTSDDEEAIHHGPARSSEDSALHGD